MPSPGIMPDSQSSTRQIPDNSDELKTLVPELDLAHFLARQEALLREICNKLPTHDKATEVEQQEIKLLRAIYETGFSPAGNEHRRVRLELNFEDRRSGVRCHVSGFWGTFVYNWWLCKQAFFGAESTVALVSMFFN